MIDKKLILNRLKNHYKCQTNQAFAKYLGISPTTLSSWYARNSMDYDLIFAKCVDIDLNKLFKSDSDDIGMGVEFKPPEIKKENPQLNKELIELIKEKDTQIISMSEKIGELKFENKQLRKGNGYNLAAEPQ